jgi:hypothetical protein
MDALHHTEDRTGGLYHSVRGNSSRFRYFSDMDATVPLRRANALQQQQFSQAIDGKCRCLPRSSETPSIRSLRMMNNLIKLARNARLSRHMPGYQSGMRDSFLFSPLQILP